MSSLTISQAKRILGNAAQNVSDEVLACEIETAILLKNLFFDQFAKSDTAMEKKRKLP